MCGFNKIFLWGFVLAGIAACGSDSAVEEGTNTDATLTPTPTAEPVDTVDSPTGENFTVSGTVSIAANVISDSDNNDPNSPLEDNSTYQNSQKINNRVSVHGFLTRSGTGNNSDQLSAQIDQSDFYEVSLQKGQVVQMQVVDYDQFNVDGQYSGDLDLALHNSEGVAIAVSNELSEFEEVIAPEDGTYFIRAYAYNGSSKYVIKIVDQSSQARFSHKSLDFIPGQAIITTKQQSQALSKGSSVLPLNAKLSHKNNNRPALAKWKVGEVKQSSLGPQFPLTKSVRVSEEKLETLKEIKRMRLQEGVEYAEPNYIRRAFRTPNDPFYRLQWHYPAMNLPQAWDISTGEPASGSIIVAVIDTGVFINHPDLNDKLVPGYDFIRSTETSNDGDGIDDNPDDPGDGQNLRPSSWHGSHVAGTIAAESDNGIGTAGVSWGAKIMPLRALGIGGGSSYDILESMRFAAGLENDSGTLPDQPAHIINLSLGGESFSQAEAQLYKQISDQGIIIVAAAGNSNTSTLFYPASYEGVISVAALDARNRRAPYSNFGTEIDIAAPGGNVASDVDGDGREDGVLSSIVDDSSGNRSAALTFYQGTSMAAPHVAGMVALMKAIYPPLDSQDVIASLESGALTLDAGDPGRDNAFGHGIADALKAVQEAQRLATGGEPIIDEAPSFVASPPLINMGLDESATVEIDNRGGGSPSIVSVEPSVFWLDIRPGATDEQGTGTYILSTNRDSLVEGIYTATAEFTFDSGQPLKVTVSMVVGNTIETAGNLSQLYVMLLDPSLPSENQVVAQAVTANNLDGTVSYTFNNVPEGNYLIFASTDIDNDGNLCQIGEGCGAYPFLNESQEITVNESLPSEINFGADIMAGFTNIGVSSLTPGEEQDRFPAKNIRRLDLKKLEPQKSKAP